MSEKYEVMKRFLFNINLYNVDYDFIRQRQSNKGILQTN